MALPTGEEKLTAAVFNVTLQRSLGIFNSMGVLCPYHGDNRSVQTANNFHATSCIRAGLITTQHNEVVSTVMRMAVASGITASCIRREVSGGLFDGHRAPTNGAGQPLEMRMDLVFSPHALSTSNRNLQDGQQLLVDVSVRDPLCPTSIRFLHTDTVQGAAAAKAESDKFNHYRNTVLPRTGHILCLGVEAPGYIGTQGLEVLRMFTEHKVRNIVDDRLRSSVKGLHMAKLRRMLSVGLHRAVSLATLRYQHNVRVSHEDGFPRTGTRNSRFDSRWNLTRRAAAGGTW
jgi:hypothetical protein